MTKKNKILITVLVILVAVQFIQPPHNNGNALATTDIFSVTQVPPEISGILKQSCYDCHSNHTNYPWYSKITPVNWWLNNHIEEGKKELNFTEFSQYSKRKQLKKLNECAELVDKGAMPLDSYTWIHKDAILSSAQKKQFIDWANANGAGYEPDAKKEKE